MRVASSKKEKTMRYLFLIIFAVVSLALSPAAALAGQTCASGPTCDAYHSGSTGMKPAVPEMICITFVQNGTDKVVLNMYDVYTPSETNVQDPSNHLVRDPISKVAGTHGKFCVGRQWVEKSTWIMVCNGHNWYDVNLAAFPDQVQAGSISTCLLGTAGCAAL